MTRPARPEDIDEICGSLPETELGISWGVVSLLLVYGVYQTVVTALNLF